uniref:Uncharacterized protein n=1 Tax=Lepeophtheirus salmonis TaxID=72036 RepID=A0A0K2V4P2_LEPSM
MDLCVKTCNSSWKRNCGILLQPLPVPFYLPGKRTLPRNKKFASQHFLVSHGS